jgi:hypothetical protein
MFYPETNEIQNNSEFLLGLLTHYWHGFVVEPLKQSNNFA